MRINFAVREFEILDVQENGVWYTGVVLSISPDRQRITLDLRGESRTFEVRNLTKVWSEHRGGR